MDVMTKAMAEKANTKLLAWIDYGEITTISKKPITKMADFKGQKIRAYSEFSTYFLETMGAAPTLLSSGEVYQALQRGTLDGAISGPTSFIDRKFYEVAKFAIKNPIVIPSFCLVANLDTWNNLPKDVQDIMQEAALEVQSWTRDECRKADAAAWEQLRAQPGFQVVEIAPDELAQWQEKVLPVQEEKFVERAGDTGRQLLDRAKEVLGR